MCQIGQKKYSLLRKFKILYYGHTMDMGPPIGYPSICLINQLLVEKTDSSVSFINNFLKIDLLHEVFNSLLVCIRLRMYSIVSATGILVKSDSTS